jgi:hypothetical protein
LKIYARRDGDEQGALHERHGQHEGSIADRRETGDPRRGAQRAAVDREQDQRKEHREDEQRALAKRPCD